MFRRVGLFLAMLCVAYTAVVVVIDPYGYFGGSSFPNMQPNDARYSKQPLLAAMRRQGKVEGLVLGSSRSMTIPSEELQARTGARFFNFAVQAGWAEDYLAMYRLARRDGVTPRIVVVGLDVRDMFQSGDVPNAVYTHDATFDGLLRYGPTISRERAMFEALARFKSLFRAEHFANALRAVALRIRPDPLPFVRYEPAGYIEHPQFEAQIAAGTYPLDTQVSGCAEAQLRYYRPDTARLAPTRQRYLAQLVEEVTSDGARLVVFLTPTRQPVLGALEATEFPRLRADLLAYLETLRARHPFAVVDATDPASFGATTDGWYDCVHFGRAVGARLAWRLANEVR